MAKLIINLPNGQEVRADGWTRLRPTPVVQVPKFTVGDRVRRSRPELWTTIVAKEFEVKAVNYVFDDTTKPPLYELTNDVWALEEDLELVPETDITVELS